MGKDKNEAAGAVAKKEAPSKINFPALAPLIPTSSLCLEECYKEQILLIRNLFTAKLCKDLVSNFSTLPLTTTPGKPKRGEALRVNDRFQLDDPAFAQKLWKETALHELVGAHKDQSIWGGEVLGLYESIRIYRYRPGQFFDQHYDESKKIEFGYSRVRAKTTWTLLIYLTACEGGETVFYPEATRKGPQPEPIVVGLEAGMALLHKHGDDCLRKYSLSLGSGVRLYWRPALSDYPIQSLREQILVRQQDSTPRRYYCRKRNPRGALFCCLDYPTTPVAPESPLLGLTV